MNKQTPPGWRLVTVADIAEVQGGIQKQQSRRPIRNKYPFLRVANVGCGRLNLQEVHEVELFKGELERLALQSGDLLVVEGNGSPDQIGRSAMWGGEIPNCVHQNHLIRLRPKGSLIPRFLELLWNSPIIAGQLRQVSNSTSGLHTLSTTKIKAFNLAIPSLDEQRQIIAVLDRAELLRKKRRKAIALLDDLAQSVFLEMFGDVVRNDRGWDDSQTLGEVAHIRSGITKGRKISADPMWAVPYMAVANVQERYLDLSAVKDIEATEVEIERYRLVKDDLLLTEGGDPDKLGRGTLWQNELPECIHQNHIFRVRIREKSEIEPIFLHRLVASERGRRYFFRSAKQTTGIASINATQLRQFPLLVPPVELQRDFARRLGALEQHKASNVVHLAELDALFASLQHRAFRSELWDTPVA